MTKGRVIARMAGFGGGVKVVTDGAVDPLRRSLRQYIRGEEFEVGKDELDLRPVPTIATAEEVYDQLMNSDDNETIYREHGLDEWAFEEGWDKEKVMQELETQLRAKA